MHAKRIGNIQIQKILCIPFIIQKGLNLWYSYGIHMAYLCISVSPSYLLRVSHSLIDL